MGLFTRLFLLGGVVLAISIFLSPKIEDYGDLTYLPYELSGNKESKVMIIFLHGYPNTFRMWDKMIESLKQDYLCLNISYPNFAKGVFRKWGMDLEDIVHMVKKTVDNVDNQNQFKKVVVSHDWGSVFSLLLDTNYPGFINDLVNLDVGDGPEKTIKSQIGAIAYQSFLAVNFLIGGPIGNTLTQGFVKMANVYGLSEEDKSRIDSSWNYLYFHLYKRLLHFRSIFENYKPSCSVAFVYGTQKPFLFHSEKYLSKLKENPKSEIHAVDADHWLMASHSDFLVDLIKRRIKNYLL